MAPPRRCISCGNPEPTPVEPEVNILIIGLECCGKDNLINSFVRSAGHYTCETRTFTNVYRCRYFFEERHFRISIQNPSYINIMKPTCYKTLQNCYRSADVVLYCYGVDTPDSLTILQKLLIPKVWKFTKNIPSVLVGNRIDLRNDPETIRRLAQRQMQPLTIDDGRRTRQSFNMNALIECMDVNPSSVCDVFRMALICFLRYQNI
ncbi:ras-like GTP-binding protein Rho1 [Trichonephila inaurata madagascariensis]|uniref:Ras-like GTP-binding protein Rho1 n=1 Tax=Trichonephila inaurata madagascariensis TaxID=2747483 RepID=A0A8X6YTN3_9ARAC|nr:ras-like GTP-binding protein Rho1 [Trichonephila inaurata madagascariensis]